MIRIGSKLDVIDHNFGKHLKRLIIARLRAESAEQFPYYLTYQYVMCRLFPARLAK